MPSAKKLSDYATLNFKDGLKRGHKDASKGIILKVMPNGGPYADGYAKGRDKGIKDAQTFPANMPAQADEQWTRSGKNQGAPPQIGMS